MLMASWRRVNEKQGLQFKKRMFVADASQDTVR